MRMLLGGPIYTVSPVEPMLTHVTWMLSVLNQCVFSDNLVRVTNHLGLSPPTIET
jgi:hypothetical protein